MNNILWYIVRKLIQAMATVGACFFFLMANDSIILYAMSVCFVGIVFCMEFMKPYGSTRALKSKLTHIELDSDDEIKLVHLIKNNW